MGAKQPENPKPRLHAAVDAFSPGAAHRSSDSRSQRSSGREAYVRNRGAHCCADPLERKEESKKETEREGGA